MVQKAKQKTVTTAVLNDKEIYPSDEVIFSHIGKHRSLWISFFDHIHAGYPAFTYEWRYYNDGKSWLMKVQNKTKTVFWLSLVDNTFRTTFHFPAKAGQAVMESPLSSELKDSFRNRDKESKLHGITVRFTGNEDIEQAMILCSLKLKIK